MGASEFRTLVTTIATALFFALGASGCFTQEIRDNQDLQARIEREVGVKALVNVKTHNGVTKVEVYLTEPLRSSPAAAKARVEALVRSKIPDVSSIVVHEKL